MKKLLRAWGLFAVAALASCQGDADKTQTSSKDQAAAAVAKPLMLTTDSTGLVPKTTAKATTVVLDGRFESAVVARRNADGTISTSCHDEQVGAESFMQGAPAAQGQEK